MRIQGELDFGPAEPNREFLPYSKIVPLLEKVSKRIDSPLVAVVMSWERPGPWIYPDCFPPAGGDESLSEFTQLARDRGWHVGSFCNGTRWVTQLFWSGYDGEKYFARAKWERNRLPNAQPATLARELGPDLAPELCLLSGRGEDSRDRERFCAAALQ